MGAGVGALASDDDAGVVRVSGEVDQAGQLGDRGTCAQGSVLFQCGVPDAVGQDPDGLADRFGDGVSDGEGGADPVLPLPVQVGEEGLRAVGAVGADEDVGAVAVGVGHLREGLVEDGHVVGRGVRYGVARSQDPGEGLAGVVEEAEQRVVAEAALVVGGGLFFSERQVTRVASMSRTMPGSSRPPAWASGMGCPVSSACSQATSRAWALAARSVFRAVLSMPASTRQAVGGR